MLTKEDRVLLKHLRQNSRKSLASISRTTKIPTSTLFCILKRLEISVIQKHVSLVDFTKLGYGLRVSFVISTKKKKELKNYLMKSRNVNSLSLVVGEYDLFADCLFQDLKELTEFREKLAEFDLKDSNENFIVDELKREGFVIS